MQLENGKYVINGASVEDIAKEHGTPLYVYDLKIIGERVNDLKTKIGAYKNTKFMYAIKTNYNPDVVKFITSKGIGIDAVSLEEVKLAMKFGVAAEDIMYTENNMTDAEMDETEELGVLINFGSISRLKKYGQKYPGNKVSVRFNPNVGAASHATNITGGPDSKFGVSYEYLDEVLKVCEEHNLTIVGVHEHIGSGWLGLEEPLVAMDVILDIARQIPTLEFVDCGGGFGVPYKEDQEPLDIETLGQKFNEKFTAFCEEYGRELTLKFEPGRFFVAEGGHLLTEVNTLKDSPNGKIFAGTDTGMHHLVRPAMYGSYHPMRNVSNPEGATKNYDVTGNICESADFFGKDFPLNELREGDILSIDFAGAYGLCMASNYQFRPLPAEVTVDESGTVKLARRRQTFEDLYNFYE